MAEWRETRHLFGTTAEEAARAHAAAEYPRESVGVIVDGNQYVRLVNRHPDPTQGWRVADDTWLDYPVRALIHGHSVQHGPSPSASDMRSQLDAAVPYGIVVTDGKEASPVRWFGRPVLDEELVGREFLAGVRDCYELVRAWFWQRRGVELRSFPRDVDWTETEPGLLDDNFMVGGFVEISADRIEPGDCMLISVPGNARPNHCAVLESADGVMLHHLRDRLSRREPWTPGWRRLTRRVVRYAA